MGRTEESANTACGRRPLRYARGHCVCPPRQSHRPGLLPAATLRHAVRLGSTSPFDPCVPPCVRRWGTSDCSRERPSPVPGSPTATQILSIHDTGPLGDPASLPSHPLPRIIVPVVPGIGHAAQGGFNLVPASFVLEAARDQLRDERAAPPGASTPVELGHKLVFQHEVYAHGLRLAHDPNRVALHRDRCQAEHPRVPCCGPDVTVTKRLPYIVKAIRILKRKVWRPSSRLLKQFDIDLRDVVPLVHELGALPSAHPRLRRSSVSHFSGSGKYAVISTAGPEWPAGSPHTAWTGRPSLVRWSSSAHGPLA